MDSWTIPYKRALEAKAKELAPVLTFGSALLAALKIENSPDGMDQITGEQSRDLVGRQVDQDRKTLRNVLAALKRIENGTYGACEGDDCGKSISKKRLDAMPWAQYCIRCQEEINKEQAEGSASHQYSYTVSSEVTVSCEITLELQTPCSDRKQSGIVATQVMTSTSEPSVFDRLALQQHHVGSYPCQGYKSRVDGEIKRTTSHRNTTRSKSRNKTTSKKSGARTRKR